MELQTKQSESLINDNTTTCVVVEEDENINSSCVKVRRASLHMLYL